MTANLVLSAHVVSGHQVASGRKGDPRFPGGTLRMQAPFFLAQGIDLRRYFSGTINVSISPRRYTVVKAWKTLRGVKWHPTEPAEDFSFFRVWVSLPGDSAPPAAGLIYYPHPETKPEHFQAPEVLELLLPFLEGIHTGAELTLHLSADEMRIV